MKRNEERTAPGSRMKEQKNGIKSEEKRRNKDKTEQK